MPAFAQYYKVTKLRRGMSGRLIMIIIIIINYERTLSLLLCYHKYGPLPFRRARAVTSLRLRYSFCCCSSPEGAQHYEMDWPFYICSSLALLLPPPPHPFLATRPAGAIDGEA